MSANDICKWQMRSNYISASVMDQNECVSSKSTSATISTCIYTGRLIYISNRWIFRTLEVSGPNERPSPFSSFGMIGVTGKSTVNQRRTIPFSWKSHLPNIRLMVVSQIAAGWPRLTSIPKIPRCVLCSLKLLWCNTSWILRYLGLDSLQQKIQNARK